jgi:hypothetical protein
VPSSFVAIGAASLVSRARSFHHSRLLLNHLPSSKNYVAIVVTEGDLILRVCQVDTWLKVASATKFVGSASFGVTIVVATRRSRDVAGKNCVVMELS